MGKVNKKRDKFPREPIMVDALHTPLFDRIVTVVRRKGNENSAEHFIVENVDMTLADIAIDGADIVLVIAEDMLDGAIYRYGNSNLGKFWEYIGVTCGYA